MIDPASFPKYILVSLGSSFPNGIKGFYGLTTIQLPAIIALKISEYPGFPGDGGVAYTETGNVNPSNATVAPTIPSAPYSKPNRLRILMYTNKETIYSTYTTGGTTVTTTFFTTKNRINVYGMYSKLAANNWLNIGGAVGAAAANRDWSLGVFPFQNFAQKYNMPQPYIFKDLWTLLPIYTATQFNTRTIGYLNEYFPDLEVTAGSGGTASVSEMAPRVEENLYVEATPDSGYEFESWTLGEGGDFVSSESRYSFAMPFVQAWETYQLHANFRLSGGPVLDYWNSFDKGQFLDEDPLDPNNPKIVLSKVDGNIVTNYDIPVEVIEDIVVETEEGATVLNQSEGVSEDIVYTDQGATVTNNVQINETITETERGATVIVNPISTDSTFTIYRYTRKGTLTQRELE